MKSRSKILLLAMLAGASMGTADAWGHHFRRYDRGGVSEAEGRYAVVFPLQQALPNPSMTPGALNPAVTQATIARTICVPGYTKTIRPPESYTEPLKRKLIAEYGYSDRRLGDYELDHLVSLELGGAPSSVQNLWPQPHHVVGNWGSFTKDQLENQLHALVCHGKISLAQAQYDISHDWISAYKQYVSQTPSESSHSRYDR
jgi:hypothetical protein